MDREQMMKTITAIYDARVKGDVPSMQALMAEDATFRFAGEEAMRDGFEAQGAIPFAEAVQGLDKGIRMISVENVTTLVEGNRVAAIWNCEVQFSGREAFATEIYNLWTFAEDGKIKDLTEFVDTAKLASEVAAVNGA